MERLFALLIGLGFIFFATLNSHADLFSDTVDISGSGKLGSLTDKLMSGAGSPFTYSLNYDVAFSPSAAVVTSAQLVLSHHGNSNTTNGELWCLYDGSSTLIGRLEESNGSGWVDQTFILPEALYAQVSGESWSFELKLQETTPGTDHLWIDRSRLSGVYTPVPIPPAIFLFGSGLSGLAFVLRKIHQER